MPAAADLLGGIFENSCVEDDYCRIGDVIEVDDSIYTTLKAADSTKKLLSRAPPQN